MLSLSELFERGEKPFSITIEANESFIDLSAGEIGPSYGFNVLIGFHSIA